MASELKMASALRLGQALADLLLGRQRAAEDDRPDPRRRTAPVGVRATLAAGLATSWPGPV